MKLWQWFKTLVSGKPHFYIGGMENPYLMRWYLIPRNERLNVYLHKFLRDDDDRALHDHPWWFVSVMLKGSYIEHLGEDWYGYKVDIVRKRFSTAFREAEHRHRVVLLKRNGVPIPCWTLVVTGRKVREWGFWCPKGFVPWYDFVDQTDSGNIGKGCE